MLGEYEQCDDSRAKWHAQITIQLGELLEDEVIVFEDGTWEVDWFDAAQGARFWKKFANRYYLREISLVPVAQWKREVIRKLNEVMPKYKRLYAFLESESGNLFVSSDDYGKSRDIYSEFPATQLASGEDYASNANDRQYEHVKIEKPLEVFMEFVRSYKDVDVLLLDECESLFCAMTCASVPGGWF